MVISRLKWTVQAGGRVTTASTLSLAIPSGKAVVVYCCFCCCVLSPLILVSNVQTSKKKKKAERFTENSHDI